MIFKLILFIQVSHLYIYVIFKKVINISGISSAELDFIMISQCQHHITSLGTYTYLSAFLGTGKILYDISQANFSSYEFKDGLICGDWFDCHPQ